MTAAGPPQPIPAMLRRAFGLFADNLVPVVVAYLFVLLPIVSAQLLAPAPDPARPPNEATLASIATLAVFVLLVWPLVNNFLLVRARASVEGTALPLDAAIRAAALRWPTAIAAGLFLALASLLVLFALGTIVALISAASGASLGATAPSGPLFVAAFIFAVPLAPFGALLYGLASVGAALESANPLRVAATAFRRTFSRRHARRTFTVGLAYVAIQLLGALAGLLTGVLLIALADGNQAPSIAASIIIQALVSGLLLFYVMVYADDIKDRDRPQAPHPAPEIQ